MQLPRRFLPVLAVLLAPSVSAQRPWAWGLTAGPSFQSEDRWDRLSHLGPSIQGYVERRLTGRLAGRAEMHVFYYGLRSAPTYLVALCPQGYLCPRAVGSSPTHELGVAALTAEAKLADLKEHTSRSYLLIGGGLYGAFRHPADEHPIRAGLNAGLGFELGRRGLLELRYHWIAGWKGGGLSVGGLGLGVKF